MKTKNADSNVEHLLSEFYIPSGLLFLVYDFAQLYLLHLN